MPEFLTDDQNLLIVSGSVSGLMSSDYNHDFGTRLPDVLVNTVTMKFYLMMPEVLSDN